MGLFLKEHDSDRSMTVFGSPAGNPSTLCGWWNNSAQFDYLIAGRVLEVGPGKHPLYEKSVLVDRDPTYNPDYVADATDLPFKDKEFDLVVAHEVLCTSPREVQLEMLKEMKRVGRSVYVRAWKLCGWRALGQCGTKVTQEEFDEL